MIPDFRKIRLKCGLELHIQLDSKRKLFCNCLTTLEEKYPTMTITRKLHPVASEIGKIDAAAEFEYLRNRTFHYQVFNNEVCLVELDEEPIHNLNPEALHIALQIALLLNCEIPDEIHIMRKIVIDGSNTSGHQRTVVVGRNGWLKYGSKKIEIIQVALEEDAAAIVGGNGEEAEKENENEATYRLNRLGVPLVEITTDVLQGYTPEQVQEIAFMIGIICRSTNSVKHGIGSIRQDVNISICNGPRVEIKGVQELGLIAKVVEKEVERQLELKKVEHETRAANADGTTRFTRPLPGAARMYPETDVVPISIDKKWIKEIESKLPEPWTDKLERFEKRMKLPKELAIQIIGSDHLSLFEKIMKKYPKLNAVVVVSVFTSILKDLGRKNIDVKKLEERHFFAIFSELAKKKIVKEAIPDLLVNFVGNPDEPIPDAIKRLNLNIMKKAELQKLIVQLVADSPNTPKEKLYGIAMGRVRGRADPQDVLKIVKRFKKK